MKNGRLLEIISMPTDMRVAKMKESKKWYPGDRAELKVEITDKLVRDFSEWSGDKNPLHLDSEYAESTRFHRRVAHGMSFGSLFSRLIGMEIPGPGALWTSQSFQFLKPVFIGDQLVLSVQVIEFLETSGLMNLDCRATNQLGEEVMLGKGEVMFAGPVEADREPHCSQQAKTAIITGASRGIGSAIARRLDSMGFTLGLTYKTSSDEAKALATTLKDAHVLAADLSDPSSVEGVYNEFKSQIGPATTLVLSAGDRDLYGPAAGSDFDQFAHHLTTQIESAHALVSAALPHMQRLGGGSIVAIGSNYTIGAPPINMAPYVVAKSALAGWVRCLAADFGRYHIRANLVAPGMTETSLLAGVQDRQKKIASVQNPMRRLGLPEDVAGAVAYLVGPDGEYVNGETLVVDGGTSMH